MLTYLIVGVINADGPARSTSAEGRGPACGRGLAFIGGLTGGSAYFTAPLYNGTTFAVAEYNRAHPNCQVELLTHDTKEEASNAVSAAASTAQDGRVLGVIGPLFSEEVQQAGATLDRAGLAFITPSATRPSLANNRWRGFHRTIGTDIDEGAAIARHLRQTMKATRIFVVDHTTWPRNPAMIQAVRQGLAGLVVGETRVSDENFATTVEQIRRSGATAVYFAGGAWEAGALAQQMRSAGVRATLVSGELLLDPQYFIRKAGPAAAEGSVSVCRACAPLRAPETLLPGYRDRFAQEPNFWSLVAYDTARIFLDGLASGIDSRAEMLDWVRTYDREGTLGRYRFNSTGELDTSLVRFWGYTMRNGTFIASDTPV